jgi:sentrin-specific protease 1
VDWLVMANKNNDLQYITDEENYDEDEENRHLHLNDEVINTYMDLITERSPETVYAFNTFFFIALSNKGYDHVFRWTKKVDIFSKEQLFIPVHIEEENHWCLISVNFKKKSIHYYDSLGGRNFKSLKIILKYLIMEYYNKKKGEFNASGWMLINEVNCPQQTNLWDCGVFVLMFAEHLSRGSPLNFSQSDMGRFRKQICIEVTNKQLLN